MDLYYVYTYRDVDNKIVYVGQGCKGRAWFCGYMKGDTKERQEWKEEQLLLGRLPCDWVSIEHRGLPKDEAIIQEKLLIAQWAPILNKHHNPEYKRPSMYDHLKEDIINMRLEGMGYQQIANMLDIPSAMTVWRIIND